MAARMVRTCSGLVSRRRFNIGWNSILSRLEKFSKVMVENWALGTITSVRSLVRMRVERKPMSSTVPTLSPNLQKSPT